MGDTDTGHIFVYFDAEIADWNSATKSNLK